MKTLNSHIARPQLQDKRECYFCGRKDGLALHHIYHGTGKREISDKNDFVVWLCHEHHNMSDNSVHFNKNMDMHLKQEQQRLFEERNGSREDFIKLVGRSYL